MCSGPDHNRNHLHCIDHIRHFENAASSKGPRNVPCTRRKKRSMDLRVRASRVRRLTQRREDAKKTRTHYARRDVDRIMNEPVWCKSFRMSLSSEFFTLAPARGNPNWGLLEVRSSIFKLVTVLTHLKCPLCNHSRFK